MGTKWCNGCQKDVSVELFQKRKRCDRIILRSRCQACENRYAEGRRLANPEKHKLACSKWYRRNPVKARANFIAGVARKSGVSPEALNHFVSGHSGCCDICGEACSTGKSLAIDHDHQQGHVRGMLCQKCNIGLGQFDDDPMKIKKAVEYLSRNPAILSQVGR